MTASKLFDFLGRVLMAAVFVNALPAKFTNFAETAGFIASKGIPEPSLLCCWWRRLWC